MLGLLVDFSSIFDHYLGTSYQKKTTQQQQQLRLVENWPMIGHIMFLHVPLA